MARDARQPDRLARPKARHAPVVVSGDHVFTAGQVGLHAGLLVELDAVARVPT
jgi:enamine deaminase RidA (YjgF/YER057c/UK114 family)